MSGNLPGVTSTREGVDSLEIRHLLILLELCTIFVQPQPLTKTGECREGFNGIIHAIEDPRSPYTQLAVTGQPLLVLAPSHLNGVRAAFSGL
jgi:hypothetical protein